MRVLEHRRHSQRDPAGVHLNDAGLALARVVRRDLGGFDRTVTSPRPRAVETAQALGVLAPDVLPELAEMPDDVGGVMGERAPKTFAEYLAQIRSSRAAQEYATRQASVWSEALGSLPEGGRLLMISHGGVIEFGACGALPRAARGWGPSLGYLEGVRLEWDRGRWVRGTVVRVPASPLSR